MTRSQTLLVSLLVLCVTTEVFTQTKWFKLRGNPVLDVGPPGTWDNSAARIDRVIRTTSGYQMWYTGYKGGVNPGPTVFPHIGVATSYDGINWTKHASNPVLSPGPSAWDSEGILRPFVIKEDSTYKMWYTGVGCCPTFRIGYSYSVDGAQWIKRSNGEPVINVGNDWESAGVEHPSVIGPDSSGGFKMWYQGIPGFHFGYATSPNETTWTKHSSNPVFVNYVSSFYPRVLLGGQTFNSWFSYSQPTAIGYVMSQDELFSNPSISAPVLVAGPAGQWDDKGVLPGDVLFDGLLFHMWYAGRDGSKFRSGYAVSPKGMDYAISTKKDSVLVVVRVPNAAGLSFSAEMESPDENPVDTLNLFDDGVHGDSLAADGVFANSWKLPSGETYYVDLKLKQDTLNFEMNNADAIITTSVSVLNQGVPSKYFLNQNFPNPFNPSTEIQFFLPQKSHVTLTIFDVLGREVATLVSEELSAGTYSTRWDASGMPSGVYFYSLQAGEFLQTKKLLLLR